MEKNAFWNDVAKAGAVMAGVQILAVMADLFLTPSSAIWATLFFVALFVVLLFVLARRRAARVGAAGFNYGQCMKYFFWMMVFAGILYGAWEIIDSELPL